MRKWYLNCGKCGNNFSVSDGYEGMHVKCRDCGKRIYIPNRSKHIFWWKVGAIAAIVIAGCIWLGVGGFIGMAFLLCWIYNH